MGATQGNEWWKLRAKHGRDKLFANSEELWDAACEYFTWCENNPLMEHDFVGKDAIEVEKRKMRPFSLHGLCLYLDCNIGYFNDFQASIKDSESKDAKDFSAVIMRIKDTVYTQQFSGAASGFLNANIIARNLGLSDKQELQNPTGSFKIEIVRPNEDE